jgi:hypothetical protein
MRVQDYPRIFILAFLVVISTGCAGQQAITPAQTPIRYIYIYKYEEPRPDKTKTSYSLYLVGDGPSGGMDYQEFVWKDGAQSPQSTSWDGTYSITGTEIAVKTGRLNAKGTIKPNEYIDIGGKRYTFFRKL